tara:strand:- start:250 stop:507 length:258 start_codon:yes stop_codon:yes gene_type:complete
MNKIKLTIASILLSSSLYAQDCEYIKLSACYQKEMITQLDSMILYLKQDKKDELIDSELARYYIKELKTLKFIIRNRSILIENED